MSGEQYSLYSKLYQQSNSYDNTTPTSQASPGASVSIPATIGTPQASPGKISTPAYNPTQFAEWYNRPVIQEVGTTSGRAKALSAYRLNYIKQYGQDAWASYIRESGIGGGHAEKLISGEGMLGEKELSLGGGTGSYWRR